MEVIDIILTAGDPGEFFCPFSGEPAMSEDGILGESCVGYIPPTLFAEPIIECRQLQRFWDDAVQSKGREAFDESLTGELAKKCLEAYEPPEDQKLIGFRVVTTTHHPRNAPELTEPVYTLGFVYILNFWSRLKMDR